MLILKIVRTVTVIITQTNHITCLAKVGYFSLKQNPSVQVHYKESSLLHSLVLLYSGNASKTTYDVSKLFTRQGEQPCSNLVSSNCAGVVFHGNETEELQNGGLGKNQRW